MSANYRDTANPKALKKQRQLEARRRARWLGHYKAVLATPEGRFVFNDLIQTSGAGKSAWSQVGMEIQRNIGRQEIGLMLTDTLKEADEEAFILMAREARALARRDANEETQEDAPPDPGQALTPFDEGP